jgi:hypothetical protein
MGVEPRYEKSDVQKRKKPRLWKSWLSLKLAVTGAFWWRGTVRDAPYRQFKRAILTCQKRKTLVNFKPSIGVLGLPAAEGKKIPKVTFDPKRKSNRADPESKTDTRWTQGFG